MFRPSQESSLRDYRDYRVQYSPEYRPRRYLGKTKYLLQNNRSDFHNRYNYDRNILPSEFNTGYTRNRFEENAIFDADLPIPVNKNELNEQFVSLKALVEDPEDLNPLTLTAIFLKVIE